MNKYRIIFETTVQIDGFTSWKDREFDLIREQITCEAKNLKDAEKVALKSANGYSYYGWSGYRHFKWSKNHIKKVSRLKKI